MTAGDRPVEQRPSGDSTGEIRFRAVVEAAPTAMVMIDDQGRIVLVNVETERLFGYPRDELLGRPVEMLVPERFRKRHVEHRAGFLADARSRQMGAGRELYCLRKDGTEAPVEIALSRVPTDEGDFVMASVVDVTERTRATHALAHKNDEVEAFVYVVSHDLRAPLVNLQGFRAELDASCRELREALRGATLPADVESRVRRILDEDIPGALRYVTASTSKFERLIDALLSLSRLGRQEYRHESVDVAAVVETTLDSLAKSVERTGAAVVVHALPPAWGDATAIGQVFSNLIANALNYLDPARPGRIEIGGEAGPPMNRYWVRDNGVGVPAAARGRLFQVFQRFHPGLAAGDGMGLAIVKRIVDRHGGRVWAESEEGVGSTFHLTLPDREKSEE